MLWITFALALQATGQLASGGSLPPAAPSLRTADVIQLVDEYRSGDADAAVEEAARRSPSSLGTLFFTRGQAAVQPGSDRAADRLSVAAHALLLTEAGFRRDHFGRYAASAPLVVATPSVGLTGMFEPHSLVSYRLMNAILVTARADGDSSHAALIRDWYVVVVSYCRYATLDCAAALLAAAVRDFPRDPVIALLSGSIAETDGRRNEASLLLRRALAGDPSLVEARLRLGRVLVAVGQTTNGRRELERALDEARASGDSFSHHFALRSLADLDTRARRTASAAARTAALPAVPPFDAATQTIVGETDVWTVYRAAQYWRVARTLTAFRRAIRLTR